MRSAAVAAATLALAVLVGAAGGARPVGGIVYARFPQVGESQLFVIGADGGMPRPLFGRRVGSDAEPAWSPDGTKVAFTRVAQGREGIVVASRGGHAARWLTSNPYRLGAPIDAHPRWSPDGRQLVFHRFLERGSTVLVVDVREGRARRLGPGFEPAWSPDGSLIAFAHRIGKFGTYDLWMMRPDGSARHRVTRNPADEKNPAWSPDGRLLAFESERNGNTDLFVISADGHNERRLTRHPAIDVSPVWSPDGRWIAFASRRAGAQFDLYVTDSRGRVERRLTTDRRAQDAQPSWR